eukprot:8842319-Prorocentrum_lima.AAC.1
MQHAEKQLDDLRSRIDPEHMGEPARLPHIPSRPRRTWLLSRQPEKTKKTACSMCRAPIFAGELR